MARSGPFCGTCRHFDEASIVWTGYDHEAACALTGELRTRFCSGTYGEPHRCHEPRETPIQFGLYPCVISDEECIRRHGRPPMRL
jgi:hypothetical protein